MEADILVPTDYPTIQAAVNAASPGDIIGVKKGTYAGAIITKEVTLIAMGKVIIDAGPYSHAPVLRAGFLFPPDFSGNGTHIEGFQFQGTIQDGIVVPDDGKLDFPIFSRGADNVTVIHNTMSDSFQGITNWHGSGWTISHNDLVNLWTICGGGIGILVGGFDGTATVSDNVISHNRIRGTLRVSPGDCGGYDGTGIVMFADFRAGPTFGAVAIKDNRVVENKVSLSSDTPGTVDVVAIELTDTRDVLGVIFDNAVGFNDLQKTVMQIALTPTTLDTVNDISRNHGDS